MNERPTIARDVASLAYDVAELVRGQEEMMHMLDGLWVVHSDLLDALHRFVQTMKPPPMVEGNGHGHDMPPLFEDDEEDDDEGTRD